MATLQHAAAKGQAVEQAIDSVSIAATQEMTLEEAGITASRASLTNGRTVRMVNVLTQRDIAAAPVQSVNDILKLTAGADVRQRGPLGAGADIGLRGGGSEQMAVLLNGVNIGDPQTAHNTSILPVAPEDIERIEILEGAAARAYGTQALLGAINIITKRHSKPGGSGNMTENTRHTVETSVEGGSFGYISTSVRGSVDSEFWQNSLSATFTRSDGYSRNGAGKLNADLRNVRSFMQGSYARDNFSAQWHAGFIDLNRGANTFYGAGWDDQYEHTMKTFTALQARAHVGKLTLCPSVYWNTSHDRFELIRGDESQVPFNYHRSSVLGFNINTWFDWVAGRTAIAAEVRNEDLVSTTLGEALSRQKHIHGSSRLYDRGMNRTITNLVLEHNIMLPHFALSAGIVAAQCSWGGGHMRVCPGGDISWTPVQRLSLFASLNTALRYPSATELYYSVGGHMADKNLKGEEITTMEGGIRWSDESLHTSAMIFHNRYSNLIDWIRHTDDGPDAPWQSVNFSWMNATGVELHTDIRPSQILHLFSPVMETLSADYCFISQTKQDVAGIQSKYALEYLRHKLVLKAVVRPFAGKTPSDTSPNARSSHSVSTFPRRASSLLSSILLSFSFRWQDRIGSYTDTSGNVARYKPYSVVDVKAEISRQHHSIFVMVNNVFSCRYVDFGNVPQPGIWVSGGIKLRY